MNIYQKFKRFKFTIDKLDFNLIKNCLVKPYIFTNHDDCLGIDLETNKSIQNALYCNFLSIKMQQRFENACCHKSSLIKAFGKSLLKRDDLVILDATSGFGNDSIELAAKAKKVIMLEKSKIVYALLQDGLERLKSALEQELESNEKIIKDTLQVEMLSLNLDFQAYARSSQKDINNIDIIYLDPMYPKDDKKTALIKKYMQYLQDLTFNSAKDSELLDLALSIAKHRIILKRPLHAEILYPKKLCYQVKSKLVRYDVYLPS